MTKRKKCGKGRCEATDKRRYRDKLECLDVLHCAANARHWAELDGTQTRRCEVRAYFCRRCHGWHTTSQAS